MALPPVASAIMPAVVSLFLPLGPALLLVKIVVTALVLPSFAVTSEWEK